MTDSLRDEIGETLYAYGADSNQCATLADALLPLVQREREVAAAKALRDASAEMPTDRQRHEVRQWLNDRASGSN